MTHEELLAREREGLRASLEEATALITDLHRILLDAGGPLKPADESRILRVQGKARLLLERGRQLEGRGDA